MSSMVTIREYDIPVPGNRRRFGRLLWRKLVSWSQLYRTRRQLLELTDRELEDLNLTRIAAIREARRPFWESDR